jgi:four helix bundle protein
MLRHERLRAWELCHDLALAVYRSTEAWPKNELYGLTSQARRAAVSAAANLAEGAAKLGSREFRRYADTSLGSLAELSYLLRLALDLKILEPREHAVIEELRTRAGGMMWKLACALSKRASSNSP